MGAVLDHLVTKESGLTLLDLGDVTYIVSPVDVLDENLRSCLDSHKDALLDARNHLYPNDTTIKENS